MNWMEAWPMGFMWFGPLFFLLVIAALVWAAGPWRGARDVVGEAITRRHSQRTLSPWRN